MTAFFAGTPRNTILCTVQGRNQKHTRNNIRRERIMYLMYGHGVAW